MSPELTDIVTASLMMIGVFFMVVSGVGILKMPDLFMRMSATTKSATVGVSCTLLAAAFYFADDLGSAARIVAIIIFLFVTAPVAAHMIGRAGYYSGSELWGKTNPDELSTRSDAGELPLRRSQDPAERINPHHEIMHDKDEDDDPTAVLGQ